MRLFVDLDGVLADFHGHFARTFGVDPLKLDRDNPANEEFVMSQIESRDDFWATMPEMPFARPLWELILRYSNEQPTIIMGIPRIRAEQKENFAKEKYPEARTVMARGRHKHRWCVPGDVLIDDHAKYGDLWRGAGGHFIHHANGIDGALNALVALYDHFGRRL